MVEKIIGVIDDLLQDRKLIGDSEFWGNWQSVLSLTTCKRCRERHGSILPIDAFKGKVQMEEHPNCRCIFIPMRTKLAGNATSMGLGGADAALAYVGELPTYYVSKNEAKQAGWQNKKGDLDKVLPGIMIGGDVYQNKSKKLPNLPGRVWREADINYEGDFATVSEFFTLTMV